MKRRLWLLLLLVVGFSGLVHAETLNLQQAVDRAMTADPRISERDYLVKAAQALEQQAQGARGLMYNVNTFLGLAPKARDGFFTNGTDTCSSTPCTVRNDGSHFDGATPWLDLQFAIIKPLYTFGKIANYEKAAKGNVEIKREDVRIQRIDTRMQVTQAYYGYLAARDVDRLLQSVLEKGDKALVLVQSWLAQGRAGTKQSDLYALRTGISVIKRYQAQAQALETVALDGLKVLTGVGLGGDLTVADDALRPVPLPPQSLAQMQAQALQRRPEVEQLKAGLKARRSLVEAHKAEGRPNLYAGVVGSFSAAPGRNRLDSPYIIDPFNNAGLTPVVGIQWNWSSGRQPAQVAQAEAELNALIQLSSFAQKGIPFEVADKYQRVHGLYKEVKALEAGSRSGRRWMIAAYADFEAGIEQPDKVLEAFKAYVTTQSDYLMTVNKYNVGVAELQRVTGAFQ